MATCRPRSRTSRKHGDDDVLLLEDAEHLAHLLDRVERHRHPRRTADEDLLVSRPAPARSAASAAGVIASVRGSPDDGTLSTAVRPRPMRCADRCAVAAARRSSPVSGLRSIVRLSTAPLDSTTTTSATPEPSPTTWTDRIVAASCGGPMTMAVCSVRSDSSRLVSCSICSSSPCALSKNVRTCCAWPGPQLARRGQRVDEVPVALLGRHPTGAGVRLLEVALLLERDHVVAHRGRRHAHRRRDVTGTHRLGGFDVFLHDGAEDGGFAFVEHRVRRSVWRYRTVSAPIR